MKESVSLTLNPRPCGLRSTVLAEREGADRHAVAEVSRSAREGEEGLPGRTSVRGHMLMPQRPCRAEAWQKLLLARAEACRRRRSRTRAREARARAHRALCPGSWP